MASGEDFTITTKGGYTLTAPDKTGTLATSGDIPANCESTTNKVTSISSSSTDTQYPSAKCMYDIVGNVEDLIDSIEVGITPSGNINITSMSQVDVMTYATAKVVADDLTAGNIRTGVEILGVTGTMEEAVPLNNAIEKIVADEWVDVEKYTNENLTAGNYHDYGASNATRGIIYIEVKSTDNFYGSVTVNSDSTLKYEFISTDYLPESGVNLPATIDATGWKSQSGTAEVTYLSWGVGRPKYICLHVTYISGGKGIPTLEEVKSNATFEIKTMRPVCVRAQEVIGTNTGTTSSGYKNNTDIIHVMLPQRITSIGHFSFQNCVNLQSINLENITYFGAQCFSGCINLSGDIYVRQAYFDSVPFANTKIRSFRLDASNNPNVSFDGCKFLEEVYLPSNVTSFGNYIFRNCWQLKDIDLSNITSLGTGVFQYCTSLNIVVNMPNLTQFEGGGNFSNSGIIGVENLGTAPYVGQFRYCPNLKYVKLPSTTLSLGNWGFADNPSLEYVYCYATTPPNFETGPFDRCPSLTAIYVPAESVSAYQTATGWSSKASIIQAIPS